MQGFSELVAELTARLQHHPDSRILVRIGGKTCSGKSFISAALVQKLKDVTIVNLDNYTISERELVKQLQSSNEVINWDTPACIDLDRLAADIHLILAGNTVTVPIWDYSINAPSATEKIELCPNKIIVLEGIFALNPKLATKNCIDVYSQHSDYSMLIRRVLRSREFTPSVDFEYMLKFVVDMSNKYIDSKLPQHYLAVSNEYNPITEAIHTKTISYRNGLSPKLLPIKFDFLNFTEVTRLFFLPKEKVILDHERIYVDQIINNPVSASPETAIYFNYLFRSDSVSELNCGIMQYSKKFHSVSFLINPVILSYLNQHFLLTGSQRSNVFTYHFAEQKISYRFQQVLTITGEQVVKKPELEIDILADRLNDNGYLNKLSRKINSLFFHPVNDICAQPHQYDVAWDEINTATEQVKLRSGPGYGF